MPDLRAYDDLDAFAEETIDELEDLEQDLAHRLIEPRGANLDDPDRGLGIEDRLGGVVDPTLAQDIEDEFRKDERVSAVSARVSELDAGKFSIEIQVAVNEEEINLRFETDASGNLFRA
jgi:phage baseplate assembly protein W